MELIQTSKAPQAIGPYSQAIRSGSTIYCSGQLALDPATGEFQNGEIVDQVSLSLQNLKAVLEEAGSDLQNVLKTTVYLSDMADFAAMNTVYAEFFGGHAPARACVEVSALPKNAKFEIDCIAKVNET